LSEPPSQRGFAFVERLGLTHALAFDAHFRVYRWPGAAA